MRSPENYVPHKRDRTLRDSMRLAETQQVGMLERLQCEGNQLVTLRQLRAGGIHFPAVVISA